MNNVLLNLINNSITVAVLFLLLMILSSLTKKKYSARYKQLALLLLGIRLLIPTNLELITIPVLRTQTTNTINSIQQKKSSQTLSHDDVLKDIDNTLSENNILNTKKISSKTSTTPTPVAIKSPNDSLSTVLSDSKNNAIDKQLIVNQNMDNKTYLSTITTVKFNKFVKLCGFIWLGGFCIVLLYTLSGFITFSRRFRHYGNKINDSSILTILDNLKDELAIKADIKLYQYNEVSSPLLIGIIKPTIILPTTDYTETQLMYILKHEMIHYKHHDLYQKLIYLFATTIHWFNPVVYFLSKEASYTMELYCDESVTNKQPVTYREQYSLTILHILKQSDKKNKVLLTTSFGNQKENIKTRFKNIMNPNLKKRGGLLLLICACIIILVSNISMNATTTGKDTIEDTVPSTTTPDPQETKDDNTTINKPKVTNIIVLGFSPYKGKHDSEQIYQTPTDSIFSISLNRETKKITCNTWLRDLYVTMPDNTTNKLGSVYACGGDACLKETMKNNFNFDLDHIIRIDFNGLERIIDTVGGVDITLTKEEADYLRKTNFISKKKYRNVSEGKQKLNGNQLLGYLRIRQLPFSSGETNDYGRTKRMVAALTSLLDEIRKQDLSSIVSLVNNCLSSICTDMTSEDLKEFLEASIPSLDNVNFSCIPSMEDCTPCVKDNRAVLLPDYDKVKTDISKFSE